MDTPPAQGAVISDLDMGQIASPEKTNPYRLAPLDLCSESIRLIELLPTSDPDMIRCRIRSYPIGPDCPPYVALSYMWDYASVKHEIELNDIRVPISRNLWWFLHRMHSRRELGPFWIDAICINQSNVLERNHQVPLMRQIYSGAESVSIWLGENVKGTNTDMAMGFLAKLQMTDVDQWSKDIPPISKRLFKAVEALLNHRYWTRIWIVQELLLAEAVCIHSGAHTVKLELLDHVAQTLWHIKSFRIYIMACNCQTLLLRIQSRQERESLPDLVRWFSQSEATVPHDKVYALLGIALGQSSVVVDYCKSLNELFEEMLDLAHEQWCDEGNMFEDQLESLNSNTRQIAEALGVKYDWYGVLKFLGIRNREEEAINAILRQVEEERNKSS
ncbi:heterokaryon incompatibility protein-domain-containing protein [Boeremia exigua]|uniref:heterokaryon incompatibility protein-domain-containing protein n=1 Tax=Boeremia exigua TaxID=749465 RepID=UPI001E8E96BA|nr:heterokaryon incompatibility protein-domain-containing protein [Boeremia exigua]KAH6616270.1 heterokaryon incompatibility protein-domain-containing protein [Boeremia exigua]